MSKFTTEKQLVWSYFQELENASIYEVDGVMDKFLSDDYSYKGSFPFRELPNKKETANQFWIPLKNAFTGLQRRVDIFIAGNNEFDGTTWVMAMGHFMGLFDNDVLGIRHTKKLATLRFADFSCVKDGKITRTGLFVDWIGLMQQVGMNPLPPSTAQYFMYPGPRKHNGILFEDADPSEGVKTLAVVNEMVNILDQINKSGSMRPPTKEELNISWDNNMIWYGPAGVGATYTIERYVEQHSGPFRECLTDKVFNGHEVRFAEGNFACFFGWPNLSNRNSGGYLGLTQSGIVADMTVVDVYCRDSEKLSENWVIIDFPYWLSQQGLDIFKRTASILNV